MLRLHLDKRGLGLQMFGQKGCEFALGFIVLYNRHDVLG